MLSALAALDSKISNVSRSPVATWTDLENAEPELASFGRQSLINCADGWGIALLGTTKRDGSPRISPLCVYLVDNTLLATVEGLKSHDLDRDPRYFLHSYWGDGQDEFAVEGEASDPITGDELRDLVQLEPRLKWCPVRALAISSAHSVIYRNFPTSDMYAEVTIWNPSQGTRRWTRDESTAN